MKIFLVLFLSALIHIECKPQEKLATPSLSLVTDPYAINAIELKWISNTENVIGFVIERKEGNGPWFIINQTEVNEKYYQDKNILPKTVYCYRIRAFGHMRFSEYSNFRFSNEALTAKKKNNP